MRLLGPLLLAALVVAQPAWAAAVQEPPRSAPTPRRVVVVPAAPAPPPTVRSSQSFASGGIGAGMTGFQPLRPFGILTGLPATGDAGPLCRAACAKAHNVCSGDEDCDTRWNQCVADCRTAK